MRFPADFVFVIACSGISATKAGSAREQYNGVSLKARAVLDICRRALGTDASALGQVVKEHGPEEIREAIRAASDSGFTQGELLARFEQFYREAEEIIPAAVRALEQRDLEVFGRLVQQSQRGAEEGLGNQIAETIALPRMARELGAVAASAFGAGFGGGVWAMTTRTQAEAFARKWRERYAAEFPALAGRSEFFVTGAGTGALSVGC